MTGAAGGIGGAVAAELVGQGATVYGFDIATAADLPGVTQIECDVTDPQSVARASESLKDVTEVVDVLVVAAGRFPSRRVEEWTSDEFEDLWRLNVAGALSVIQALLVQLRRSNHGRIILISSSAVHQGIPGFVPYAATKAAMIGMARSLAAELGPDGITVNVVTPGLTATQAALDGDVAQFFDGVVASQMIKRRLEPTDLAPGIAYLCSPGADMVTGQVLNIDGGSVTY